LKEFSNASKGLDKKIEVNSNSQKKSRNSLRMSLKKLTLTLTSFDRPNRLMNSRNNFVKNLERKELPL